MAIKTVFKIKLFAIILSAVVADVEKLSNYIIRNGTETFVYGPSGFSDHLLHTYRIGSTNFDEVLANNEPSWAVMTKEIHPTPDVNYLNEETVVLYFTAMRAASKTTAIGVAHSDLFSLPQGYYNTISTPLEEEKLANLTSPTLLIPATGSPQLIFIDTTNRRVDEVSLSPNGLSVISEKRTLLEATQYWEKGNFKSIQALENNGMYYLLYTAADGMTVGVARSAYPVGPFEKKPHPIGLAKGINSRSIHRDNILWGPGGWPYLA